MNFQNIVLSALLGNAFANAKCGKDGCAKPTRGGHPFPTTHYSDCQSFLSCTVTPTTSTFVTTVTITPDLVATTEVATTVLVTSTTETDTVPALTQTVSSASPVFKRAIPALQHWLNPPQSVIDAATANDPEVTSCPTAVPAYASACSGSSAFETACSCLSLTKTTTTLSIQSTTLTLTTTLPTPVSTVLQTATTVLDVVETITYGTSTTEVIYPTCTATTSKRVTGPNYCECQYDESCGKVESDTCKQQPEASSYRDCLDQCDFYIDCLAFNWDYQSGTCTLCENAEYFNNTIYGDDRTANAMRVPVACGGTGGYPCQSA